MGKGGGSSDSSTQKTYNNPAPWILPDIKSILGQLMQQFDPNGQLAQNPFPNQQLAGLNPTELQGLSGTVNTAEGEQGNVLSALGLTGDTLSGKYLDPSTNPFLKGTSDAMNAQTVAQYQNAIAPGQMSGAALSGAFGGSADAANRALGQFNLGNTLGNMNEQLYGQNYQNERANQLNTLENLGGIENAAQEPNNAILGAGGVSQQQQQQQYNTDYQNATQQAQYPYQLFQYLTQELGGLDMGAGQSWGKASGGNAGGTSGLQDALGLGGLGLGFANLFGGGAGSAASGIGASLAPLLAML